MLNELARDLVLRFTCMDRPVEDLVVHLLLLSNRKNDFPMGPFLTDKKGEILITREAMAAVVEAEKSEFPMDYDGTLADCTGVKIYVENDVGLRQRIDRLKKFYPGEAAKLRSVISGSANRRFEPVSLDVEAQPDGVVEVVLRRVGVER